jgi:hypothetical protein
MKLHACWVLTAMRRVGARGGLVLAVSSAGLAHGANFGDGETRAPAAPAAAKSPISPSLLASRTSGVAPLAVVFDATGTSDRATARPFHDLEYRWDFGDPAGSPSSGTTWSHGSRAAASSRNSATGPVAAHVFERPGTYAVRMTASNGASTASVSVQIEVEDPDKFFEGPWTTCVSASGTFTDCPPGAKQFTTSDFGEALRSHIASGRRLLFRRGDAWTTRGNSVISATGPGIVGAFGSGAKPVIRMLGPVPQDYAFILFSSPHSPRMKDWRVMDLEFDGGGMRQPIGIYTRGGVDQLTLLRLDAHDLHTGFGISEDILDHWNGRGGRPGHQLYDQLAIVDCATRNILGGGGSYSLYASARQFALLGNRFDNSGTGSHTVRIPHAQLAVISNNTLTGAGTRQHELKLHAHNWSRVSVSNPRGVGTYSEGIVLSDNRIIGSASGWMVTLGPQDSEVDERLRQILVERNWFSGASKANYLMLLVWSKETTVRNNIFDTSRMWYQNGLFVGRRRGGEAQMVPTDIGVYNNTFYSSSQGAGFTAITLDELAANVVIKNNLAYAPLDVRRAMLRGGGGPGLVQAGNGSESDVGQSPQWAKAAPAAPADFMPNSGSYAIDSGSPVPVFSDFLLRRRPRGRGIDRGALEAP